MFGWSCQLASAEKEFAKISCSAFYQVVIKFPAKCRFNLNLNLSLLSFCEVNLREGGGRCVERSGVRRMHPNLPSSFLFLFHLTESASKL